MKLRVINCRTFAAGGCGLSKEVRGVFNPTLAAHDESNHTVFLKDPLIAAQFDIPSFMSRIQSYFDPFLPTLQSLFLNHPTESNWQIIFLVGFQHLENLSLSCDRRLLRELQVVL